MALRAATRRRLPPSAFVYPRQRKYPINTLKRARNALQRSRQSNTFGSYPTVARAVKKKWGARVAAVGGPKGKVSSPGTRKRSGRKRSTTNRRRSR